MSLSSFLQQPPVRQRFREEFRKPTLAGVHKPVLAPPLSMRYQLIGTAFDYLLRFYLEHRNPKAKRKPWVAAAGLAILEGPTYFDINKKAFAPETKQYKAARVAFDRALAAHARYIANGKVTGALLQAAVTLAKLDVVYRTGGMYIDENFGGAHPSDIRELRKLISIVSPRLFQAKKHCVLNPNFGHASRLIGGADADIIIDGALIEIKVISTLEIDRDYFNQLIGYLALAEINRLRGVACTPRITKIGFYFARHAHLEVWAVRELINSETFPAFLHWFSRAAREHRAPAQQRQPKRKARTSKRRKAVSQR